MVMLNVPYSPDTLYSCLLKEHTCVLFLTIEILFPFSGGAAVMDLISGHNMETLGSEVLQLDGIGGLQVNRVNSPTGGAS